MKNTSYILLLLCLSPVLLPACSWFDSDAPKASEQTEEKKQEIYNLVDSTRIIRELLKKDAITQILEDTDPEQLEILLNNFSPALMAFESEVLSSTLPVILHFFKPNSPEYTTIHNILNELAVEYHDRVKFVEIDTEKLFSIAEKAEVEKLPTLMSVKQRNELDRIEEVVDKEKIQQLIQGLIEHTDSE